MMKRTSDVGILLGAAALAGAMLLFVTVFAQAMLSSPSTAVPVPAPTATPAGPEAEPIRPAGERSARAEDPSSEALPVEALRLAVDRAPFAPDRRAPSDRYRMPGERVAVAEAPPPPPELPPAPDFRLLGTVTGADGGVAVVQIDGERPHVMAMGEELFGYRIASIGSGSVTMQGQGRDVNLAVAGPMPTGPAASDQRGGRGEQQQRGGDARGLQAQLMEAARERAIEMARQMQQRGGGQVEVQMRDGQIVIQGPDGQTRTMRLPTGPDGAQVRGGVIMQQRQQQRPPQRGGGGGGGGGG
jgi:hypothetical protein